MGMEMIFDSAKDKVRSVYDKFLYHGKANQPRNQRGQGYAQDTNRPVKSRFSSRQEEPEETNVVDINAYQQGQQYQPAYQPPYQNYYSQQPSQAQQPVYQSYQQPQQAQMQPETQQQQAQEQPTVQAAENAAMSIRLINARGMGDCRSAITLLRNGDAVLIVLENINDQAEQRRLVDTLSGACYSLMATITKVSRFGVYLLAPQKMAVYADQFINQMNGVQTRQTPAPAYQPQRTAYQPQPVNMQYPQQMQQSFPRRSTMQQEAPQQPFYSQTAPQGAVNSSFTAQPAGYGYAPDEAKAQ